MRRSALAAFLTEMRVRPVCARVAPHNIVSVRVLQRCGFAIVGEDVGPDSVKELLLALTAESRTEEAAS